MRRILGGCDCIRGQSRLSRRICMCPYVSSYFVTVSDGSLIAAVAACFSSRPLVRAVDFDADTELKRGVTDLKRCAEALTTPASD